jgi:hypothetical protein
MRGVYGVPGGANDADEFGQSEAIGAEIQAIRHHQDALRTWEFVDDADVTIA